MRTNLNGQSDVERQKIVLLQRILEELQKQNVSADVYTESLTERMVELAASDDALKWMVAVSLPATPATSMEVPVDTVGVQLYENQSDPLLHVTIANDDLAQSIWIGPEGVGINTGERIPGTEWRPFVMPSGTSLWAVTDVGVVSARVAIGHNIKKHMDDFYRAMP